MPELLRNKLKQFQYTAFGFRLDIERICLVLELERAIGAHT
jgi:hypothetical protein